MRPLALVTFLLVKRPAGYALQFSTRLAQEDEVGPSQTVGLTCFPQSSTFRQRRETLYHRHVPWIAQQMISRFRW